MGIIQNSTQPRVDGHPSVVLSRARTGPRRKLSEDLRRFHKPTAEKTGKLFLDDLEIDVNTGWKWQNQDPASTRGILDDLIAKRGDAVHRARPLTAGAPPAPHLLKYDDRRRPSASSRAG